MKTLIQAASTAEVLGGKKVLKKQIETELDLEQAVTNGLPLTTISATIAAIYPDDKNKQYAVVPRPTLARKKKEGQNLTSEESQRIERIARVFAFAKQVWGDEAKSRAFMDKPHPMLDDRSPFEACLSELGARQVENILGRIFFGISA